MRAPQYVFGGCRCLQQHDPECDQLKAVLVSPSSIVQLPPAGAAECVMLRVAGLWAGRRLSRATYPERSRFDCTSVHVGVVVDNVALDTLFSEYVCFSPSLSVNRYVYIYSSPTLSNLGSRQHCEVTPSPFSVIASKHRTACTVCGIAACRVRKITS